MDIRGHDDRHGHQGVAWSGVPKLAKVVVPPTPERALLVKRHRVLVPGVEREDEAKTRNGADFSGVLLGAITQLPMLVAAPCEVRCLPLVGPS